MMPPMMPPAPAQCAGCCVAPPPFALTHAARDSPKDVAQARRTNMGTRKKPMRRNTAAVIAASVTVHEDIGGIHLANPAQPPPGQIQDIAVCGHDGVFRGDPGSLREARIGHQMASLMALSARARSV